VQKSAHGVRSAYAYLLEMCAYFPLAGKKLRLTREYACLLVAWSAHFSAIVSDHRFSQSPPE
jgi:hypothetical protein